VALRPAELFRLEREHGSLEAAAEALPEHRDELERHAANVRLIAAQVEAAPSELQPRVRPPDPPLQHVARQAVLDLAGEPLEPLAGTLSKFLPEREPDAPAPQRRRGRHGKDYPGKAVEEVVRRATAERANGRNLGRTLQNELGADVDHVTPYAVGVIFRMIDDGRLAVGARKGWLKIDGEFSTTPGFINLHELETRS
jgi:hypothetical protein